MDIPKPWHGVREFLKEYAIIVIGVLTALGAEQGVEVLHERGLAREASAAIDAEMRDNVNRIAFRQAQQPCIDKRLKEITGLLADWANGKAPPAGLFLGDPGDFPMIQQRWQANLNSGRFSRQSEEEQGRQASFYTQLAILQDMESREHYVWSELRTLELGPAAHPLGHRRSIATEIHKPKPWPGRLRPRRPVYRLRPGRGG